MFAVADMDEQTGSRPARGGRIEIRSERVKALALSSRPARGGRIEMQQMIQTLNHQVVPPRTGRAD